MILVTITITDSNAINITVSIQRSRINKTLNLVSVTEQAHDGLIQVIEGEDVHDRMCEDGCCTESVAH